MTSFQEQMALHEASRRATAALEDSSRTAIGHIFDRWDDGDYTPTTVRYHLEAVIRRAYRASAAVARSVAQESSAIPGWQSHDVFNTDYLQSLVSDVRRSLREYKNGVLTRSQAIYRMEHSAGVASQRGYTDQMIASYTELEDFGFQLDKYWVANFVNNTPCPACVRLHGTRVGLHENFRIIDGESGVYRDLIGPPRHPRCKCRLFIFVVTLENAFLSPNFEYPQASPNMITTRQVKALPKSVFDAVRATLLSVIRFFRRRR